MLTLIDLEKGDGEEDSVSLDLRENNVSHQWYRKRIWRRRIIVLSKINMKPLYAF